MSLINCRSGWDEYPARSTSRPMSLLLPMAFPKSRLSGFASASKPRAPVMADVARVGANTTEPTKSPPITRYMAIPPEPRAQQHHHTPGSASDQSNNIRMWKFTTGPANFAPRPPSRLRSHSGILQFCRTLSETVRFPWRTSDNVRFMSAIGNVFLATAASRPRSEPDADARAG
jgi:hypothetical protein